MALPTKRTAMVPDNIIALLLIELFTADLYLLVICFITIMSLSELGGNSVACINLELGRVAS